MTIKQKLESVAPDTSLKMFSFKMSPMQHRITKVVSGHWDISQGELIRRALNLVYSQIQDPKLLARIRAVKETYINEE